MFQRLWGTTVFALPMRMIPLETCFQANYTEIVNTPRKLKSSTTQKPDLLQAF